MHNLDRTLDPEESFGDDFEADFGSAAFDDEAFEGDFDDEEMEVEPEGSAMPFTEEEELELASELLTVESDEELDLFLGKLFRRVGRRLRKFGRRVKRIARPLRRVLRPIAKRLLPIAGRAVGTFFGGPVGGAIGGRAASLAGKIFRLELEGLAPEDQELEVARRFVRLAGSAATEAARMPTKVSPGRAARMATSSAARRYAPGLIGGGGQRRKGRWIRRGNRIVLFGV